MMSQRGVGMQRKLVWALSPLLWLAGSGVARADDEPIVEKLEHGEVNWSKKTIIATGSGAPALKNADNVAQVRLAAERAAKIDAFRNVVEALKGIRINGLDTAAAPLNDAQIRTQVQGIVQGCKTVDTRYYSDGGVDVVVKCPLDGGLATVLSPTKDRKTLNTTGEAKYTGLIIDAVGLKAQPALAPKVSEGTTELYAPEMVIPSFLRQHGAAGYARSVDLAKQDARVGKNPLVLKASGTGGSPSDLTISAEEAAKLKDQNLTFLAEARVVIATDGP
jgi:hypothetical protein